MKTGLRLISVLVVGLFVVLLTTCSLVGVSISDRISMFISSLNGDRTTTYQNLDPNIAAYSTANAGYWNTTFSTSYEPYYFSPNPPNTSNASDVEVTILGTSYSLLHKFVMVNVGTTSDDWRIHSLEYYSGGIWNVYF